ncbi:MAG: sigma-70 family RNA polymerase sigma factor [Acidobacteriota bacterium]
MTADALVLMSLPLVGSGKRAPQEPMDEARFEIFYRRTAGGLWAYLHRMTGDPATADDLLQKAFFRILRANPAVADDDHMRRYLYRTATNLALDHFRERKRERLGSSLREVAAPRSDGGELSHDVQRVFAELKPRERALLWLAHVEGSDHDEIGTALGIKPKSVRVLLFRARKRLAELLEKKGIGPGVMR